MSDVRVTRENIIKRLDQAIKTDPKVQGLLRALHLRLAEIELELSKKKKLTPSRARRSK